MYAGTSTDLLYQDPTQRKWSPPAMNQPEPLKVFLQHRIRSVIAKEWWDFVVNVNNMNSDHASLLYSEANLCPSFQHFLKSREKEINYILKKRPVIKPRIFSGSERTDVLSEPPLPPRENLPPKKSCSAELEKILNELYPNEKSFIKRKPRLSGPASKQRKTPTKKFQSAYSVKDSTREVADHSITLASLLREDHSSVTALSAHKPGIFKVHTAAKNDKENSNKKIEYAVSDFDVNRNKVSNKMKIKKVIKKVKKKKYFLTDKFSPIRSYLEDETPELKIEWIKRYKIKKCSVNVKRLTNKEIKEALKPKLKSMPVIPENLEVSDKSVVKTAIKIEPAPPTICHSQSSQNQADNKPPTTVLITTRAIPIEPVHSIKANINSSISPSCSIVAKVDEEKLVAESTSSNSLTPHSSLEKCSENSNSSTSIKYRSNQKENVAIAEKYKPKELTKDLKTYYYGGIVPLGKKVITNEKTRHFLSLKEKKVKETSSDSNDSVSPLKEKNVQTINTEPKPEVIPALSIVKCAEKNNESVIKGPENSQEDNAVQENSIAENGLENCDNVKDSGNEQLFDNEAIVEASQDEVEDNDEGTLVIDESKETDDNDVEDPMSPEEVIVSSKVNSEIQSAMAEQESYDCESPEVIDDIPDTIVIDDIPDTIVVNDSPDIVNDSPDIVNDSPDIVNDSLDNTISNDSPDNIVNNSPDNTVNDSPDITIANDSPCNTDTIANDSPCNTDTIANDSPCNTDTIANDSPCNTDTIANDSPCNTVTIANDSPCNTDTIANDSPCNTDTIANAPNNALINDSPNDIVNNNSPDKSVSNEIIKSDDNVVPKIKIEQIELDEPLMSNSTNLSLLKHVNSKSSEENSHKNSVTKSILIISTIDSQKEEDNSVDEPQAKRPRIEVNLAEMKVNITTKASPEIETLKDDLHCRVCSETFNSVTDWLSHFDKEVPKCTPNLQMGWDRPEVPLC